MSSNSHVHISKCVFLHCILSLCYVCTAVRCPQLESLGRPHKVGLLAECMHYVCFRSRSMHNLVFAFHKCRLYQLLSVCLASKHLSINIAASKP